MPAEHMIPAKPVGKPQDGGMCWMSLPAFGKATKDMDSRLEEIAIAADDTVPKPSSGVSVNALDQATRGHPSCKIRLWHCLPIRDFVSGGLMEVTLKRREEGIGQNIEANK